MTRSTEFSIDNETYSMPADRYYGRENHMWVQFDRSAEQVLIGIDALGLAALGDLAYVTLPLVGTSVQRGKPMGSLEAAKMTGGLTSPISGVIVSRNEEVVRNPSLVNQDPYSLGWLVSVQPADWVNESTQLVTGNDLPAWVEAELIRYRQHGWID